MKKMKKILAMLLALTMVLGMGLTSMAADKVITVNLPVDDESTVVYSAQIIEEDRESSLGWKFVKDGTDFEAPFVKAFLNKNAVENGDVELVIKALINLGALEAVNNFAVNGDINSDTTESMEEEQIANLYYPEAVDWSKGENLNRAMTAVQANFTTEAVVTSGEEGAVVPATAEVHVNDAEIGLYGIKIETTGFTYIPMAVYVGTGFNNLTVTAKGSEDKIIKTIDNIGAEGDTDESDKSVANGDTVEFTAKVRYPFFDTGRTDREFVITDTLTGGTFTEDPVVVTVKESESATNVKTLTKDSDYKIEFSMVESKPVFKITIINENAEPKVDYYNAAYAGYIIEVKYNVIVGTDGAEIENKIKTNFDTEGDSVKLDKVQVTITKTDDSETNVKLPGATFAIYEEVTAAAEGCITKENVTVKEFNATETTTKTLYLKEIATGITSSVEDETKGTVVFTGLDAEKKYYIKETNAPKGYSLNETYYGLNTPEEKTEDGSKEYTFDNFEGITVVDTKLNALPSTGGIGTTIFTVAGCGIMIAAAFFFFASRKKENE